MPDLFPTPQGAQEVTSFRQQSLSESWIGFDKIQLVLERREKNVTEQRILLPNRTAMRGENVILLRADRSPLVLNTRFQPDALLELAGGTPYPFGAFDTLTLRTIEDGFGSMSWARWTNNAGLTCVLAFRRVDKTMRTLAANANVMDILLRNCINGDEETALAPIGADAVRFATTSTTPSAAPRMLSPLAAPRP